MKNTTVLSLMLCFGIVLEVSAISKDIKQKYPYPLLTDDYGILNENDIAAYTWGLEPRPFTIQGFSGVYNYWQCFPREYIEVTLTDTGATASEFGKDTIADLLIRVRIKPDLIHQYSMRARSGAKDFKKRFNTWQRIMENQEYICLAGSFLFLDHEVENGKKREIYHWFFEKIKSKNKRINCDSYLGSCTPTYRKYLQEKAREEKRHKTDRIW
jgi:hypothetical protein